MAIVKKVLGGVFKSGLVGDVMNVGYGVVDYKNAKAKGDSTPVAATKAVATGIFTEMLGMKSMLFYGAIAAGKGMWSVGENNARIMSAGYNARGKFGSGYFNMTEAGYTMRQRSLNAIRNNGMNINSTLGNEARTYFRSTL